MIGLTPVLIVEGCTQQQGTNKRQQLLRQRVSGLGGDRDSNKTHTAYCKTATQQHSQAARQQQHARKQKRAAQQSRAEQSRAEQSRAEEGATHSAMDVRRPFDSGARSSTVSSTASVRFIFSAAPARNREMKNAPLFQRKAPSNVCPEPVLIT